MQIEIFQDSGKYWRFRIKSRNGKIISQSEAYERKQSAVQTIERMIKSFKNTDVKIIGKD